jgi:hypothetical protein
MFSLVYADQKTEPERGIPSVDPCARSTVDFENGN